LLGLGVRHGYRLQKWQCAHWLSFIAAWWMGSGRERQPPSREISDSQCWAHV
jgi:hypothetical protein